MTCSRTSSEQFTVDKDPRGASPRLNVGWLPRDAATKWQGLRATIASSLTVCDRH